MLNSLKKNKKGAVLFTVIVVMMVLIIVVMSTFVVAVAMQKKAIKNFLDSQSYITAESLVSAYVQCLTFRDPPSVATPSANANQAKLMRRALSKLPTAAMNPAGCISEINFNFNGSAVTNAQGMGEVTEFKVKRLSTNTFQVYAVVTDGVKDAATTFSDSRSTTRVTATITVDAKADSGLFDSAMITTGSTNTMNSGAQIYGGYIDAESNPTAPFATGSTRLIGTYFSAKPSVFINGGNKFFLGIKKMYDNSSAMVVDEREFFHCTKDAEFAGVTIYSMATEKNINKAPYVLIDGDLRVGSFCSSGSTNTTTIGSGLTSPVNVFVNGDAYLDNLVMNGNVYCNGTITLGSNVSHGTTFKIYGAGGEAALPGSVTFPTGGTYKPAKYPSVQDFLNCNYDRNDDGVSNDYNDDFDYWDGDGYNLESLATGGFTSVGTGPYTISTDMRVDGSPLVPGGWGGNANLWIINNTITVQPNGSDVWVVTPPSVEMYGGGYINVDNSLNTLEYDAAGKPYWKYNVYLYTPSGGHVTFNSGNAVGFGGRQGAGLSSSSKSFDDFKADNNYLGTNPPTGNLADLNPAPNFYWLIEGTGAASINGVSIHGYIYAPEYQFTSNSGKGEITGGGMGSSYYNTQLLPSAGSYYDSTTFKPIVIGSIIGDMATLNTSTGSVYIQPSNSIFTDPNATSMEDLQWYVKNYSNLKVK